jgi:hypothetical protein
MQQMKEAEHLGWILCLEASIMTSSSRCEAEFWRKCEVFLRGLHKEQAMQRAYWVPIQHFL